MNTVSPVDKSLEVPRKPRCLTFSPDGQVIVISGNIIIALKPRNRLFRCHVIVTILTSYYRRWPQRVFLVPHR